MCACLRLRAESQHETLVWASGHRDDAEGETFSEPNRALRLGAGTAAQRHQAAAASRGGEDRAGGDRSRLLCSGVCANQLTWNVCSGGAAEGGPRLQVSVPGVFHA